MLWRCKIAAGVLSGSRLADGVVGDTAPLFGLAPRRSATSADGELCETAKHPSACRLRAFISAAGFVTQCFFPCLALALRSWQAP